MNDKARKYLADILSAISLVEELSVDTPDFSRYSKDNKTKSAVERQLGIIGEAINQLSKIDPAISFSMGGKIVAFRNCIVHSYDSIDDSIGWTILRTHLPPLKEEVKILLA